MRQSQSEVCFVPLIEGRKGSIQMEGIIVNTIAAKQTDGKLDSESSLGTASREWIQRSVRSCLTLYKNANTSSTDTSFALRCLRLLPAHYTPEDTNRSLFTPFCLRRTLICCIECLSSSLLSEHWTCWTKSTRNCLSKDPSASKSSIGSTRNKHRPEGSEAVQLMASLQQ